MEKQRKELEKALEKQIRELDEELKQRKELEEKLIRERQNHVKEKEAITTRHGEEINEEEKKHEKEKKTLTKLVGTLTTGNQQGLMMIRVVRVRGPAVPKRIQISE